MSGDEGNSDKTVTVLIADDNAENLKVLSRMLESNGYKVRLAYNGEQVLKSLTVAPVDVILLDVHMPKMDGYETCKAIKSHDAYRFIPVIFISALTETFNKVQAFKIGAADYVTKPIEMDELLMRIKTHYDLYAMRNKLEQMVVDRTLKLMEREKLLKNVLDNVPDMVYLFDINSGKVTILNRETFCGYSREELESTDMLSSAVHPEDRDSIAENRNSIISHAGGIHQSIEFRFKNKDGQWVWIQRRENVANYNTSGKPILLLVTLSDITEMKHLQEQINHTQKMEAIGHLAGGIAHDFNNILSAIIGYTDIIVADIPKGGELEHNLKQILHASDRAKHLVAQILSFSRQSVDIKEHIFLEPIMKEIGELLRATLPSSIELEMIHQYESKPILANATKIYEIIMNLCTNAAYAMGERGKLEIRNEEKTVTAPLHGKTGVINPGLYALITVKDTGCGISPEIQNRIFEPYFTTKPEGEGTGLGLAVVSGIIQSYGGTVILSSVVGKGTEFQIFIPKSDQNVKVEEEVLTEVPHGTGRIMYVDDEAPLCAMMKKMLTHLGYTITVFNESTKALEAFKHAPDSFDLIISDQTMPGISGFELAQQMILIRPDLPIILCTGFSKAIDSNKIRQAGIYELCMKPFYLKDIANKIHDALTQAHR